MMPTAAATKIVHVQSQVGTDVDGDDVVDFNVVPREYSFVLAILAQRMRREVGLSQPTPGLVVPPLSGRAASSVRRAVVGFALVLPAEAVARGAGAAGVSAARLQSGRHAHVLVVEWSIRCFRRVHFTGRVLSRKIPETGPPADVCYTWQSDEKKLSAAASNVTILCRQRRQRLRRRMRPSGKGSVLVVVKRRPPHFGQTMPRGLSSRGALVMGLAFPL